MNQWRPKVQVLSQVLTELIFSSHSFTTLCEESLPMITVSNSSYKCARSQFKLWHFNPFLYLFLWNFLLPVVLLCYNSLFVSPFNPFLSHLAPAFLALISAAEILCLVFEVNKICLSLRILHYLVSSFYLFIFVSTGYRLHLHFLFIYCIRWRDQRRKQAVDP